jgi:hypothetical protein
LRTVSRQLNQLRTPEQQLRAIQEEAARETQEFLTQFPDARLHEQMIARIIEAESEAGREVDLRTVYFKLRQSAINQGLDWSKPLEPQIEALKQQKQQQQQQQETLPLVSGRPVVSRFQ